MAFVSRRFGRPQERRLGIVETAIGWLIDLGLQGIPFLTGFDPFRDQTSMLLSMGWLP